ncbi:restriction endonuclease subunit S [Neisseria flavescens]|uniref:Type I restriction modification DNA specificity domain protein n=1 Tax=Neisseria flavescens NRL30031/H210 TaxID=546264 RepID=C0EMB3_NEIFL|nr:restriction endonuclease subunit S [Neisseria flavescens]EEG33821.1 type I restriction modification DNA specificity domain protein [Neisseria flavescens NRL30031/H210]QCL68671.1 restriction endonuclease subunit S [Neisseria flavescens]
MNKQQEPRLRFKGFTEEWKNKTLGDLGRVEMCRRIFKEQTQPSGEIPFFKIGTFGQEPDAFISSELFEEYRQKYPYPKQGDILISAAGTIGRTVEFTGENAYFQDSNIVWLRFDESQITSTFLNITYQNIKWGLEGSTIKRLYNSDLLSAEITVPSLPEQTHLGLFFRRLDSQIAESRAVLEKSRQLKKAMLAKMFPANGEKIPQIRFKGFEGEWETYQICDLFRITRGNVLATTNLVDNKNEDYCYPVYSSQTKNKGLMGYWKHYLFENAITWTTDGANAGDVNFRSGKFYCTNVCGVLINEDGFANQCIAEILNLVTHSYVSYVGNPKLMNNVMAEIPILIPPTIKEQTAIGNFFLQLDETIALQSAEVEKLNRLKKGLLAAMLV